MPNQAKPAPNTLPAAQHSHEADPGAQQSASSVHAPEAARGSRRAPPALRRPADILGMQRAVGNRAVQRLLDLQRPGSTPAQQSDQTLTAPVQRQAEPKPEASESTGAEITQLAAQIAQHKAQLLAAWGKAGSGQRITEEQIDVVIAGLRMTAASDNPKAQEAVLREIKASPSSQTADNPADLQAAGLQRSPANGANRQHGVLQRGGDGEEPGPLVPVWADRLFALLVLILLLYLFFAARPRADVDAEEADGDAQGAGAQGAVAAPAAPRARRRRGGGGAQQPAAAAAAPQQQAAAAGPVVYNVGDTIELEDAERVRTALDLENQANQAAYQAACLTVNQYQQQRRAYDHDRQQGYVPTNIVGASTQITVDNGSRRAYGNLQGYFPAAGAPYQEYNINPGFGAVGNYRKIEPANPVNNFSHWVGWNITHPGGNWIRGWDTALNRWQVWNPVAHTGANLPGHVAAAPVAPSAAQQQLAQNGYIEKSLRLAGYEIKVVGQRRQ